MFRVRSTARISGVLGGGEGETGCGRDKWQECRGQLSKPGWGIRVEKIEREE